MSVEKETAIIIIDNGCLNLRAGNMRKSSHAISEQGNGACGNNDNSREACEASQYSLAVAIHKKCQLKKKRIKIITDNECFSLRTGNMRDSSHALYEHANASRGTDAK